MTSLSLSLIISSLNMKGCHVISKNPYKVIIHYTVKEKQCIEECFLPVVNDISSKNICADHTIAVLLQIVSLSVLLYAVKGGSMLS